MRYNNTKKIIIDERKLNILVRLGCPDKQILDVIKTGNFEKTGDSIIDETLECLVDFKEFDNWGGKRTGAGRPPKIKEDNQVENQDDIQDGNQDIIQVVDKDKDRDINKKGDCKGGKKKVLIDEYFNFGDCEDVIDIANQYDERVLNRLYKFLMDTFMGSQVDVEWIRKQAERFANGT